MELTHVLIMVANYYGIGKSVEEAKKNLSKIRGSRLTAREPQVWWVVTEDTAVDDVDGRLTWPSAGAAPIEINRINSPRHVTKAGKVHS
jgi:hypothetical protein